MIEFCRLLVVDLAFDCLVCLPMSKENQLNYTPPPSHRNVWSSAYRTYSNKAYFHHQGKKVRIGIQTKITFFEDTSFHFTGKYFSFESIF